MELIKMICLLIRYVFNKYASDMGNWFDEIRDNQEAIAGEIEHILRYGTIRQKIQLLKGEF